MKLKMHVSAGKNAFKIKGIGEFSDALNIEVSSSAQDGKANEELIEKLSDFFNCTVKILSGKASREKFIDLELDEKEFKAKLKENELG